MATLLFNRASVPEDEVFLVPFLVTFLNVSVVEFEFDVVGVFSEFIVLELFTGFYEVLIPVRPVKFDLFAVVWNSVFFLVRRPALGYEVAIFVLPLEKPIKILIYRCLLAFPVRCFLGFRLRL
jgi:hypothetical protein